ncbi:MAG: hypothetical protein IJS08_11395 [Victivallales bacterium]|nr:hypothetical protein [Victivallales bacterium]
MYVCECSDSLPPIEKPIKKCDNCGKWRKDVKKDEEHFCECSAPSPFSSKGKIMCKQCKGVLRVCVCSGSQVPTEKPIKKCDNCGKWRKDEKQCECSSPSPFSSKGKIMCKQCKGVLQVCVCSGSQVPTEKPIKKCNKCGKWRKDEKQCECKDPSPYSSNGKIMCKKCKGVLQVCVCPDSQLPDKKPIEKCDKCSLWKKKIEPDVPRWFTGYFFDVIYFLKDWIYYFEYLVSSYRTRYYGQSPSTSRELFHVWMKAVFNGTYKTNNKEEKEGALSLRIWSFFGVRFIFYCGNTMAVDANTEYLPIAFHFPFIGKTRVMPVPSNTASWEREFRRSLAGKSEFENRSIQWIGDLTYFPERHDTNAQNAEDFVRDFLKSVYNGDDDSLKTAFVKNSPLAGQSAKELRNILPSKCKLGRAANLMYNVYVVPCMVINDDIASAYRIIAVRIDEKLYIFDVISP